MYEGGDDSISEDVEDSRIIDVEFVEHERQDTTRPNEKPPSHNPLALPRGAPSQRGQARVVTITNQKGGVGKTTSVINIAAQLGLRGHRVLVIDADAQGNCATGLGVDKRLVTATTRDLILQPERAIEARHQTAVDGVHMIVGDRSLVGLDQELLRQLGRERRLSDAMQKFVFPPEFDAFHNPRVDPVAMYVFDFQYTLDKNDLSYIWQNMAPRDFKKLSFQNRTVSHNLLNNELINSRILNNENLRWMVFKVKQRATSDYYDLVVDQAGQATRQINQNRGRRSRNYPIQFNWPYDYLSFVELIKIDVDILLKSATRKKRVAKKQGNRSAPVKTGNKTARKK